jgi:hypothetical protein
VTRENAFAGTGQHVKNTVACQDHGQGNDDAAIRRPSDQLQQPASWQRTTSSPGGLSPLLRPLDPELFRLNPVGHWAKWIFFLYAGSFLLPAWGEGDGTIPGYGAFALGLLGCCMAGGGVFSDFVSGQVPHWTAHDVTWIMGVVTWLANPVLWIGLIRLATDRCRSAARHGSVAFLLGLCFFFFAKGDRLQVSWGYYCWIGSMISLAAAGWWGTWPIRRWRS